jgi:hypothetical protein
MPSSVNFTREEFDKTEAIFWREANSRRYSTCAIVGNGSILKGKKLGREIDSHEKVFRFNGAPLKNFKEVRSIKNFQVIDLYSFYRMWAQN